MNTICERCGHGIRVCDRYDVASFAAATGESPNTALTRVGVSGKSMQEARCHGVTRNLADRMATRAGFHPYEIWPEMRDHDFQAHAVPCADERCGRLFIPVRKGHRFCSTNCMKRKHARDRYSDPEFRMKRSEHYRRYYAENRERLLADRRTPSGRRANNLAQKRRYRSDPDARARKLAQNRASNQRNKANEEAA